jgi:endonuclease/exonuclease/phosphatase family metal-dependent hydrolase
MYEAHKYSHGSYARTFPAAFPFLHLDRIYVRNVKVMHSQTINSKTIQLSDHLPLFCEVELMPSNFFSHHQGNHV